MGCQREIAREIIEAQADYLLAVKENQGRLYDDVRDLFEGAEARGVLSIVIARAAGPKQRRDLMRVTLKNSLDGLWMPF